MQSAPVVTQLLDMPSVWEGREIFRSTAGNLTFAELREGMLHFAGWLDRAAGVRPGDRVAVCLPRSLVAAQAIYGILAAGAAYVPLQFRGPPARLNQILRSIAPRLLLTTAEMEARLAAAGSVACPVQPLEPDAGLEGLRQLCRGTPAKPTVAAVGAEDLAVVFFTSGSTGQPKGVMWSQRTMVTALEWLGGYRQGVPDDRLVGHTGLHYSPSVDLFFPLPCGCSEFLLTDAEAMFAGHVARVMAGERATVFACSATLARMLVEDGNLEKLDLGALRRMEFLGERMPVPVLRRLMAALPQVRFVNIYGATEAFDLSHFAVPRPLPDDMAALPLGAPIGNYAMSIRDEDDAEVAPGTVGEICVRGPTVMAGYWDDPALTATRRLGGDPETYLTGDLGFFDGQGQLQLVGRKDHVVKLRGHRFDLGEIEAALKAHPAVRDAVAFVCALPNEENEIRAVVLADGSPELEGELSRLCIEQLPSFARPSRVMAVAAFPILSTGKIDRRALQALVASAAEPIPAVPTTPTPAAAGFDPAELGKAGE